MVQSNLRHGRQPRDERGDGFARRQTLDYLGYERENRERAVGLQRIELSGIRLKF